jgi:hypothetical protein
MTYKQHKYFKVQKISGALCSITNQRLGAGNPRGTGKTEKSELG